MEKSLMDKVRNHTCDDIDKDMVVSRLKAAHDGLDEIIMDISAAMDKLHKFCGDKRDELTLLGFSFVLACDDKIMHNDDDTLNGGVPILCSFGNKDNIKNLIQVIKDAIDS